MPSGLTESRCNGGSLPVCVPVIFQKPAPYVLAGIESGDDWIHDSRRSIDYVKRRMEPVLGSFPCGDFLGIFIGDPTRVDAVHVDSAQHVILCRGSRHHVQRRLRHVCMRMSRRLERTVELALHR